MRDIPAVSQGTNGRVRLANGLGAWRRYWVKFEDGTIHGQISHDDLARPDQTDAWEQHQEVLRLAAEQGEQAAAATADASAAGDGAGGASGIAAQIPAHILERSKAAKQRLLG